MQEPRTLNREPGATSPDRKGGGIPGNPARLRSRLVKTPLACARGSFTTPPRSRSGLVNNTARLRSRFVRSE
jgi:hypothetical protein